MKKSMILPIVLALGVGMSFAQFKEGGRTGGKTRIARDSVITIEDGTLYHKTMRKGVTSTSINGGDVLYTQCVGGVCSETSKFDPASYSWQKRDLSSGNWTNYEDPTFEHNGEYRLQVRYTYNVGSVQVTQKMRDQTVGWKRTLQNIARNSLDNHPIKSVTVNGNSFSPKSLNSCTAGVSCNTAKTTYTCDLLWSCVYVADSISTVGQAHSIVLKPFCNDGSDNCSAEYTGPAKSYSDDTVKFTVKNTNEDYGWGISPGDLSDQCKPSPEGFSPALCYGLVASFLLEAIPINAPSVNGIDSLYFSAIEAGYFAFLNNNEEFDVRALVENGNYPYVFADTTDGNDTIYYPLTRRTIPIVYGEYEHGTITGPAKAHDGELLFLSVVPDDGYDLKEIYTEGPDSLTHELKRNFNSPTVADMQEDGSRLVMFMAERGFTQEIFADFIVVGQKVNMILPQNGGGTYSVISRTKEHKASEETNFITNAAGSKIAVRPVPDKGYAVKSVTCEYGKRSGGKATISASLGTDSLYYCDIPDTSLLSSAILERSEAIKIRVSFGKISDFDIKVSGKGVVVAYVKGKYDPATAVGSYCSNIKDENGGEDCSAVEGDTVIIDIEEYDGHPWKSLQCTVNDTTQTCVGDEVNQMIMGTKKAEIRVQFNATSYSLVKLGNNGSGVLPGDYELYSDFAGKNVATQAHALDTIYIRAVEENRYVDMYWYEDTLGVLPIYDSSLAYYIPFFVMPAKDVEVMPARISPTASLTVKTKGRGLVDYWSDVNNVDGNEDFGRIPVYGYVVGPFKVEPAEGYEYDTTVCVDGAGKALELVSEKSQSHSEIYSVSDSTNVTCTVTFAPNTYDISLTVGKHGVAEDLVDSAATDSKVSFNVTPVTDYEIDFVKAYYTEKDSSNEDVSVLLKLSNTYDQKKNTYTYKFTMPAHDVNVEVAFKEIKSSSSSAKSSSSSAKAKSSSSSAKAKSSSSSAKAKSSSSKAKSSSSSAKAKSSSSKKKTDLPVMAQVPQFSLFVNGRTMQIAGAHVGSQMEVFDLQGHRVLSGSVDAANFSVAMPRPGSYLVRIAGQTQNVNIK